MPRLPGAPLTTRDADLKRMDAACKTLVRELCEARRASGLDCDLDDFPARAEWSYLRSRQTPDRQYQVYIDATFSMSGDETGPLLISSALVASGRTAVDCLEMFHNWATDVVENWGAERNFIAVFRDKAIRGEQGEREAEKDAVEQLAEAKAAAVREGTRTRMQEWLAKKLDFKLRKFGLKATPVMSLPSKEGA